MHRLHQRSISSIRIHFRTAERTTPMQQQEPMMPGSDQMMAGGIFGVIVFLLWLAMMLFFLVSYIIVLYAMWQAMRAHQSIARSAFELVRIMQNKP
jgi:hypothetical protein